MEIASYVFMTIGGVFFLLGGLGVLRMPDTFKRIQAGTKATTLGAFSMLIGVFFANPSWVTKILAKLSKKEILTKVGIEKEGESKRY